MKSKAGVFCFILFLFFQISMPAFAQLQTEALVSKFFPDPDIQMTTPGFSKTSGFMNYTDMMDYLQVLANKRSDIVKIQFIGESVSGKKIPLVFLSKEPEKSKIKIWMQGGLHGNEPAGTESLLLFINDLVKAGNIDSILNFVSFARMYLAVFR